MTIASAPSELKVMSLPTQGQPKDFSGAVGNFQVSSDVSPANAAAGDPLTLRLHVSGAGNFDRVDTPMLDHLDHWKTYPAKSSFKPTDTVGYQGEKVFEQPLIAAQPGEQSIPGLEFSFFNPTTRHYERGQTPPIKVTIASSLAGSSLAALSDSTGLNGAGTIGATPGLRADHPTPGNAVSDLRPLYFRGSFLVIPTTLSLLLAAVWFAARRDTARARSKTAARVLAQLDAAVRNADSYSFFDAARKGLLHTYAARWQMPVDQITPEALKARLGETGEEVERLFALAEETKYGGKPTGGADLQSWLRLVRGQLADEGQ
jgi:hypothetical protein